MRAPVSHKEQQRMNRSVEQGSEVSSISEQPAVSCSPDCQDQRQTGFNTITERSLSTADDTVNQCFPNLVMKRGNSDTRQRFVDSLCIAPPPERPADARDNRGMEV